MRQSWRDLLFLHFPCDPAEIAPLIPHGLEIDTFPDADGVERAWIGLVPFMMRDVRWIFAPAVPGTHTFPETNVRTYVHRNGRDPGVWFFSLDATSRLAVITARAAFALPYFQARMSLDRRASEVTYEGERTGAAYRIEARLGSQMAQLSPLEFFLIERYLLYAARGDRLWSGRVWHQPYGLREVKVRRLGESLVKATGIEPRSFVHSVFSEGVDVDVFPLRRLV